MIYLNKLKLLTNFQQFGKFHEYSQRTLYINCVICNKKKKEKVIKVKEKVPKKIKDPPKPSKYKHTINLPSTDMSLYIKDVKQHELFLQNTGDWESMYERQREQPEREQEFVLHDGPPYANGDLHIGHALNKVLKDITGRQKMLEGYKLHYVPGWDCHGLPIELKAVKQLAEQDAADTLQPLEIRSRARQFSNECVERQKAVFQRWGVVGRWARPYLTSHPRYVARQLHLFDRLQRRGLIFQALLPVHYSPSSRTTLAEAELEYNDKHVSPAVLLALRAVSAPPSLQALLSSHELPELHVPVFTTTPWTLPFNRAICFNPGLRYSLVRATTAAGRTLALVWASDLLHLLEPAGLSWQSCGEVDASWLSSVQYQCPEWGGGGGAAGPLCPLLPSDHVTASLGSGLVHTAPAHGREDFEVGVRHGLRLDSAVDAAGCYGASAGPELAGLPVMDEGNKAVLAILERGPAGAVLLQVKDLVHSYPYDWRTKQPVLTLATKQWFIDTQALQQQAVEAVAGLAVYPSQSQGTSNLSQYLQRQYWCISRQRVWGVPLPVFYDADTNEPLTDETIVPHVCSVIERDGSDAWWQQTEEQLLPPALVQHYRDQGRPLPVKGEDILDIWFDSGCSWQSLEGRTADLVLEGVDQYRGWFQSSLLTSLADTGAPPYKSILVHGFTVDSHGRKMSKSLGNVVDPSLITDGDDSGTKALGADLLRYWACATGTLHATPPCGDNIIANCKDELQRLRAILRLLLGSLADYPFDSPAPELESLPLLERWALHRLHTYDNKVWTHYRQYEYHSVVATNLKYVSSELSKIYIPAIKHRLYCNPRSCPERREVQWVLLQVLQRLLTNMTPVVPHLTQDVARYLTPGECPQLQVRCPPPPDWLCPTTEEAVQVCLSLRDACNLQHATSSPSAALARMDVVVTCQGPRYRALKLLQPDDISNDSAVCELLQSASVNIKEALEEKEEEGWQLQLTESGESCCDRCRKWRATPGSELCCHCRTFMQHWQQDNQLQQ